METTETWRPVYGLEGLYEVSSCGQIFKDLRPTRAIAFDYSVNAETVRRIKAGKTWVWLTGASPQAGLCRGSLHRHSKLNELQVMAIKSDLRTYAEIAAEHGVNQATVGKIKTGNLCPITHHYREVQP